MNYLISKFFNYDQLRSIQKIMGESEWHNGLQSLTKSQKFPDKDLSLVKKNFQCNLDHPIVFNGLDNNLEFLNFTYAKHSSVPMGTKTPKGGYYRPHFDHINCGHFSTTVFLNPPNSYHGGELVLWLNCEEKKFKLDPGYGITYETGTPHCVNDVTYGDRDVIVFWTTSYIPDMEDLRRWRYYDMMTARHDNGTDHMNLSKFSTSLHSHFREKCNKIARKYL